MMDKCSKCGFEPAPIWKNRAWKLYQEYSRIDELEAWPEHRELAEILRKIGPTAKNEVSYSDGYYNYQYRTDGTVVRIAQKLARSRDSMSEPGKATHKHKRPPNEE